MSALDISCCQFDSRNVPFDFMSVTSVDKTPGLAYSSLSNLLQQIPVDPYVVLGIEQHFSPCNVVLLLQRSFIAVGTMVDMTPVSWKVVKLYWPERKTFARQISKSYACTFCAQRLFEMVSLIRQACRNGLVLSLISCSSDINMSAH